MQRLGTYHASPNREAPILHTRLSELDTARLVACAAADGMSRSEYTRYAIGLACERTELENPDLRAIMLRPHDS